MIAANNKNMGKIEKAQLWSMLCKWQDGYKEENFVPLFEQTEMGRKGVTPRWLQ